MIPVSKIYFSKEEEEAVIRVLRSGHVVQGKEVLSFEEEFARFIGSKYAIAVVNGTAALHLALLSLKIGTGDEVITTPYSFIASANSILYTGATPVFVDVNSDYNINLEKIEEKITSKTKAIMPVHIFGNPCEVEDILKLGNKHNIPVIEDACQAHGAEFKSKKIGTFGKLACFSLYATKNITTIEGGIITTDDKDLYEYLTMARTHGAKNKYYHDFLGYNYRLTDVQAAIGRIQLKNLEENNQKRMENARYLTEGLVGIEGLDLPKESSYKKHVFHQYAVTVTEKFPLKREEFLDILTKNQVGYGIHYPLPIHKQKLFKDLGYKDSYPISEKLSSQTVSLPVHQYLTKSDLDHIINTIRDIQ